MQPSGSSGFVKQWWYCLFVPLCKYEWGLFLYFGPLMHTSNYSLIRTCLMLRALKGMWWACISGALHHQQRAISHTCSRWGSRWPSLIRTWRITALRWHNRETRSHCCVQVFEGEVWASRLLVEVWE